MAYILTLTTTEAVRAAIGIAEDSGELDDEVFIDLSIEEMLSVWVYSWLTVTIASVKSGNDSASEENDSRVIAWKALTSAATYYCAYLIVLSAPISFAERNEDSNNKMKRPSYDPDKLAQQFLNQANFFKGVCSEKVAQVAVAVPAFIGISSPSYDPVTNS